MRIEEAIGQRIRGARERVGITQEQLGEWLEPLLGRAWPRQAVSLAEQGKRAFTAAELTAIAYIVGTTAGNLFTLPPGVNSLELPSGSTLTREDIRQASAVGVTSPALTVERLQNTLSDLMSDLEAMDARGAAVKETVRRLHDEIGLATSVINAENTERET